MAWNLQVFENCLTYENNRNISYYNFIILSWYGGGGGGYSHTLPIRVCAAQRGRDFEAPDLERGIHFRGFF